MSDNYDMRKKLLELQTELLKNANNKQDDQAGSQSKESAHSTAALQNQVELNNVLPLLKEIYTGQQKILNMLVEINNKIK